VNIRANVADAKPKSKPPFRAEHIGSLLRPPDLLEQRGRFARGEIGQDDLTAAEDRAILDAIALQESLGFKFVTDGEFRRRSYHSFFYAELGKLRIDTIGGTDAIGTEKGERHGGGRGAQPMAAIGSRVQWTHPINADDAAFLKAHSSRLPKITIPGPCALHFRGGSAAVTATAYKDVDQFWSDIVEAFSKELRALAEAGCHYVQIDETAFAKFGDPDVQAMLAARDRHLYRRNQSHPARRAGGSAHRHASMPRQSRRPLACRGQLRQRRRAIVQRVGNAVLFSRIRHAAGG
jgi:5-methyltetrahydropteroyltriglutamate--homocysteine methyltransferase